MMVRMLTLRWMIVGSDDELGFEEVELEEEDPVYGNSIIKYSHQFTFAKF